MYVLIIVAKEYLNIKPKDPYILLFMIPGTMIPGPPYYVRNMTNRRVEKS